MEREFLAESDLLNISAPDGIGEFLYRIFLIRILQAGTRVLDRLPFSTQFCMGNICASLLPEVYLEDLASRRRFLQ